MCSLWLKVLNCDACKSIRSKSAVYTVPGMIFNQELDFFGAILVVRKEDETLD